MAIPATIRDDFPILRRIVNGRPIVYRVNENWGFRAAHRFEARDGRLEEQSYAIYRDLRSWTAALTLRLRDNRNGPEDFSIAFTFSLKAFPRFGLGADTVRPSWLLGS